MDTNVIVITGNLTKSPELRYTNTGKSVATLRLASNRMQDKGTDFVNVVVWNGAAEACAKHLGKGAKVCVTGSLRTTEWERDGQKQYGFEISAQRVQFLGSRPPSDAPEAVEPSTERDFTDDDIPF